MLLGTAPYMSPEQARGRTVDKRADIWAFGCVLYEMLTGSPAFAGDGVADVLANVIKTEPDWTCSPGGHTHGAASVPAALPAERSPATFPRYRRRASRDGGRLRAADPRQRLDATRRALSRATSPTPAGRSRSWRSPARLRSSRSRPDAPAEVAETRLEIVTPPAVDPLSLAISPDGRSVVFQAEQDPPRLWLRPLDSQEARALAGTDGCELSVLVAGQPVGRVHRRWCVETDRSRQRPRAHAGDRRYLRAGGAWSADGTILIGSVIGPLNSVPADGGAVKQATKLLQGQSQSTLAAVSAGWRRFLLFATGSRPTSARCVSRDR